LVIIHISLLNFPTYAFSDGIIFARFVLRDRYDREARVVCFRENESGKLRALGGRVASQDAFDSSDKGPLS
jgi:hypothetical protein